MLATCADRKHAMPRRPRGFMLALLATIFSAQAAGGDTTPTPEPAPWVCATCTFYYGWSGSASLGVTYVSDSSYRFGEYTGYYDKGFYAAADGSVVFRDKDGYFFDASGGNLGLDSRWIEVKGGRQGEFELRAQFRQTPQFLFDTSQTPFLGAGTTAQALPPNWVYGATTAQMSALSAAQQPVGISNQRRTANFGGDLTPPASNWDFTFNLGRDTQTGTDITAANFLTNTTQLVAPIDYRTNQIDASVGYTQGTWQIRGGYYGSFFSDADTSLEWANPFMPIAPGTGLGNMSLAPSNAFNQFSLTGTWQLPKSTRLTASLAYGRETQDDTFIPTTINPSLTSGPLPASNLSGLVNTGNYIVRLTSAPLKNLSLAGEYLIDRRDNHTPQNAYQQIPSDTFIAANQTNLPYSFDRELAKISAAYRIVPQLKLQAGVEEERFDRTFESVLSTRTSSYWAEASSSSASSFDFSAKYTHSQRRLDSYEFDAQVSPVDNPLLQQFDLANRNRDQWRATASYTPIANVGLDFTVQRNDDKYEDSPIGLTADKDSSATLDVNWKPTDAASIDAFVTHELINSDQAGSQSFTVPDWYGTNHVAVDTVGISAKWRNAIPNVDLGADTSYSYSRERIAVATGTAEVPFPNNTVNYAAVKLWASYHINPHCSLRLQYAYERLSTLDWALDGVEPDTVSNVLALGVNSPRYQVNVIEMRFQYAF
jgi:MtrB/PioB family decaheme-associated outer membrane protein